MSSTVTNYSSNINTTYPIAGQDNDTQGFRDNFSNIKNSFTAASNEITSIQNLAAFTNQTSNFQYNVVQNPTLQSYGVLVQNNTLVPVSGPQNVDFTQGNYQQWALTSGTNFTVINWPTAGIQAAVKLELTNVGTGTFTATFVASSGTTVKLDSGLNGSFHALNTTTTYIYEVQSTNGGVTQLVKLTGMYS
jgi:hypothetical protein